MNFFTIIIFLKFVWYISAHVHIGGSYFNGTKTLVERNHIPNVLEDGVTKVILVDFSGNVDITSDTFGGKGWSNVAYLEINNRNMYGEAHFEFKQECFSHLHNLRELHIHARQGFDKDFLDDVSTHLTVLDLSDCWTIRKDELRNALLNKTGIMPNLQQLNFTRVGFDSSDGKFVLDEDFFKFVSTRPVTYLDLSYMRIHHVDWNSFLENCFHFETVILNNIQFMERGVNSNLNKKGIPFSRECKNLQVLEASDISLVSNDIIFMCSPFISWRNINATVHVDDYHCLRTLETLNIDGMCRRFDSPRIFEDQTLYLLSKYAWDLKHLSLRRNNFKKIDVTLYCPFLSLESLSLANNKLEFIYFGDSTCLTGLEMLDLNDNNLYRMLQNSNDVFVKGMQAFQKLRHIHLARNGIGTLTPQMFASNVQLQTIDLSGNYIKQIHFKVFPLTCLRILNITSTNISKLDQESMNTMDDADKENGQKHQWLVDLRDNPLSCSSCADSEHVSWLIDKTFIMKEDISCINENGLKVSISEIVRNKIKNKCMQRRMVIVLVSSTLSVALCCAAIVAGYLYSRHRAKKEAMEGLLKEGQGEYEFIVFLSFSSCDELFVYEHVIDRLQSHLQHRLAVNRDLVCFGDRYFRHGRRVADETVECLRRSYIFVAVISDEFLRSQYCQLEFDQAILQCKPVVLFVKGTIDEGLLPPSLAELYYRNTRVIWKKENGDYQLKTSWECVCESLISTKTRKHSGRCCIL